MDEINYLLCLARVQRTAMVQRNRERGRDEVGASVVEWVIITAILAAVVIAVGVILTNKFRSKAESVDLG